MIMNFPALWLQLQFLISYNSIVLHIVCTFAGSSVCIVARNSMRFPKFFQKRVPKNRENPCDGDEKGRENPAQRYAKTDNGKL